MEANNIETEKRGPVPFEPRGPHHGYIGAFLILLAWLMAPYDLYAGVDIAFAIVGGLILLDDLIEHTVTGNTPLRIFFEKVLVPFLRRLQELKKED